MKFYKLTFEVWYLSFIRLLIKLNRENNDRQPLIDYLKNYYIKNPTNLNYVREFEQDYSSSNVIKWYTKDCFIFSLLNKAFRSHNYELLILFRFFIADLYEQLLSLQDKQTISTDTVFYRGQRMCNDEMEVLKETQLICCTSFFSTTKSENLASEIFAGTSSETDQAVLFIIRPSSFHYKQLKFADISSLSTIDVEQEVLFAVGSYFRIESKWFDTYNNRWTIQLHETATQENKDHANRPFYIDIISIGFYLMVTDDDFQSVQTFYNVLLHQTNSFMWCIACHVGLGLIEYYKKNYAEALEEIWIAIEICIDEDLQDKCEIIRNIYCILANIYREMNNYDMALQFYKDARKIHTKDYFIKKSANTFWNMFIYRDKFNSFVINDKYFYYCDRPILHMVLLYKRTEQWDSARENFQKMLRNYDEHENSEIEMFVKVLNYQHEKWNINDFIDKNRSFIGGKTQARWLDDEYKYNIIYAYEELGQYYVKHKCLDYASLCFREVLEGEIKRESSSYITCFEGLGKVDIMKQEYSMAIDWFKKVIDIVINAKDISILNSTAIELYEQILLIYNEKLNDSLSPIAYMKENIDILIRRIDCLEQVNNLIVTILKTTVYFYHTTHRESEIISVCNYMEQILDVFKIDQPSCKKWLCILSKCNLNTFKKIHDHFCQPIIDQNYSIYLKLYDKIYDLFLTKMEGQYNSEIEQYESLRRPLKILELDQEYSKLTS